LHNKKIIPLIFIEKLKNLGFNGAVQTGFSLILSIVIFFVSDKYDFLLLFWNLLVLFVPITGDCISTILKTPETFRNSKIVLYNSCISAFLVLLLIVLFINFALYCNYGEFTSSCFFNLFFRFSIGVFPFAVYFKYSNERIIENNRSSELD